MQSKHFHDFDAFAESIRDVDATMTLQNAKHRIWSVNHVYLPNIHVQLGRLGSGNICEGQSWSNGFVLYLPLTNACEYSVNGVIIAKNSFMVLEPGCEFCVATKYEHDWCSVFVPTDKLAECNDGGTASVRETAKWGRVSAEDPSSAQRFRALVNRTLTAARKYDLFESSAAAATLEDALASVAVDVLRQDRRGPHRGEGRPTIPRQEIIRKCKRHFEQHESELIRLHELAAAADVSERTLRSAFNEYYGIGPVRYLQLRKLQQVHRALKESDPDAVKVGQVLLEYGVWEFGRFASRYRQQFGELPSETLWKKKQTRRFP